MDQQPSLREKALIALRFKIDPTVLSQHDLKWAIAQELAYQGYYASFEQVSDLDEDQEAPSLSLPDIEMYTTVSDRAIHRQQEL